MEAKSYMLSDYEFSTAITMLVDDKLEMSNYTLVDVTGMEDIASLVESIDRMIPDDFTHQMERFLMEAEDDATVWIMHTRDEVCGILYIRDS